MHRPWKGEIFARREREDRQIKTESETDREKERHMETERGRDKQREREREREGAETDRGSGRDSILSYLYHVYSGLVFHETHEHFRHTFFKPSSDAPIHNVLEARSLCDASKTISK